jgi:uncharacterized repeat protein (TIGR01451 family)
MNDKFDELAKGMAQSVKGQSAIDYFRFATCPWKLPQLWYGLGLAMGLACAGTPSAIASACITEYATPTTNSGPDLIAAGPDGNLWFTESSGNNIGRITTAGVITEFPIPTSDSGPSGITAGPDGNLWFTEFLANNIGRITTPGVITEFPIPTAGSAPLGITAGPDGNLWFTGSDNIGRITTAGTITEFPIPTAASAPRGITVGADGNLWFTESSGNNIGRITTTGAITEFPIPTAKSGPDLIAAGPDGNLWFTESSGNIGRITTTGAITEFPIATSNSGPSSITAGPDGNLWFTEYLGNNIGRITMTGAITEFSIPTAGSLPLGITAGPDGNLWFTESSGNIGRLQFPVELNCPSDETFYATSCASAFVVNFPPPKVIGGCTPVSLTCTPVSGSTFPLGSTTVTCTAVDAQTNTASCSFAVNVVASADLSISLGATKNPASQFTYTITVTNSGPTVSCGVVITDKLPAQLAFVSASTTQGSLITPAIGATGVLTANLGNLENAGIAVVKVTVKVLAKGSLTIVNTASVSSGTADPNPVNNSAMVNTYYFGNKKVSPN